MAYTTLDLQRDNQVTWLTLNRPDALNALNSTMVTELRDFFGGLPADRDTPIVMVCGIGKFSKNTTLYLKSMGYRRVRSLKGGINEWVRKQQPTEAGR